MKTIAIVSGGMDSVTMAYKYYAHHYWDLHLLSFDYGQRHNKELLYAARCAAALGVEHDVIDLTSLTGLLKGSSLTDDSVPVPDGHYAEQSMKATIVPNRNAIMLSIAYGVAEAQGAEGVAFAAHGGDHFIYPDCRQEFTAAFALMQEVALDNSHIALMVPFIEIDKSEIVKIGDRLGVPFVDTWSCYKGGDLHCGLCGTCNERKEAFLLAGVKDPTEYEGA